MTSRTRQSKALVDCHFIHFSYLSAGLTFAHKPYDSRPSYTLPCSRAVWRINTIPISHTFFRMSLKSRSRTSQGRIRLLTVRYAHCPELTGQPNVPMPEARDFHCLGERSIPSDHVTVRIVVQQPTNRCDQVKRIPSWMSKHPVICSILKDPPPPRQRETGRSRVP